MEQSVCALISWRRRPSVVFRAVSAYWKKIKCLPDRGPNPAAGFISWAQQERRLGSVPRNQVSLTGLMACCYMPVLVCPTVCGSCFPSHTSSLTVVFSVVFLILLINSVKWMKAGFIRDFFLRMRNLAPKLPSYVLWYQIPVETVQMFPFCWTCVELVQTHLASALKKRFWSCSKCESWHNAGTSLRSIRFRNSVMFLKKWKTIFLITFHVVRLIASHNSMKEKKI